MSRRSIIFSKGEYYHIYNRGSNREDIFRERENYLYLLRLVNDAIKEYNICVIAYCLMPNHYHFLLRQDSDNTPSDFIQKVFNSYTKAFNKRYYRTGTLFEDRFKAKSVLKQEYLIHLCRYIHRNPIDAHLVKNLEDWEFSNYLEWIGKRNGRLVDLEFVHDNFRSPQEYKKFVLEYEPPEKLKDELCWWLFD
ncbi:MAG: transposase [Ignavibacteriae bacterium]|nr:transposase [Ignavibacteriota bacterium]